ncbi:Isoeugenol synthase 1 [Heracleum sosnowskyi]|uniref:Isoeugenol synthase 1 n=1 Tax=Heracleum sosnowskyi TaxID=360622 RepID=A0AAD8H3D8_9APIA|nr:Isoeugenol synthase 1 [Heracleum sosnowskyi]
MMSGEKRKIMIFGATGYLGTYMAKASVSLGHPTYAFVRPIKSHDLQPSKLQLLKEFESLGITIFQGELDEHDKLVDALRQVDIVIVTLGMPSYLEQLKIIIAMKEAGNIKRFIPSEFGNEVDRISPLPPFKAICDKKKQVRRAAEKSGIPYTFISANSFGAYFVNILLRPFDEKLHKATIYGTGETKFVCNYEKDVAEYTLKVATDPRTENCIVIYRLPRNIITQLDLISSWEKKTGRAMEKTFISEEEIIKLSQSSSFQNAAVSSIAYSIFIKGEQMNYELKQDDLDVGKLYPDHKYTSVDELLDIFMVNPPKSGISVYE